MLPPEYPVMYGVPSGMHPGMTASLESLHPFFPQARMPEALLSEDDLAFFMLLVTYSDALDALPLETTRSFSDLRELDAVLGGMLEYLYTDNSPFGITYATTAASCVSDRKP